MNVNRDRNVLEHMIKYCDEIAYTMQVMGNNKFIEIVGVLYKYRPIWIFWK